MPDLSTREVIDRIFKEPGIKYELTEFENLGKPIHEILTTFPTTIETGRDAGKTKYFLKSLVPFSSGKEEVQVYVEGGKSAPEEIVRQLWVYKLIQQYGYKEDEIDLEKSVQFGGEIGTKAADIIVYTDNTKETPKIIVECKKPKRKDGLEQLKSYMNAKGAPVAVWSNGSDSIILYRPYPKEFDDTLFDLPKRGQEPKDVLEAKKTLLQLRREFNFKKIVQDLEELVLANMGGQSEFDEIFKLIFAKIWDEREAQENRSDKVVEFSKALDPDITYDRINTLFHKATEEWPGIFEEGENIKLAKPHLQVCVGPLEGVRLLGSDLRVMDDAFEYLLPTEAKKKKGQFFTPRHVVDMCVRMLNPKRNEYIMDPACGSAGFLMHTMNWCWPADDPDGREKRKHRYASKFLFGIDFELKAAKTSRALMLIAGDGHTNIFGPDVNSLDPKTWYDTPSGRELMRALRKNKLTAKKIPDNDTLTDDDKAWEYFDDLKFDMVLTNPPFAGEIKDRKMLVHYELAKPALKRAKNKAAKEERDVLFVERVLKMLRPGGRAAIVLPQGKFNNSSLAYIREWILKKARLFAVVGLHPNTFKPHTGTKTSVLFIQKYTREQIDEINKVHDEVASSCPDYEADLKALLKKYEKKEDVPEDSISEEVLDLIMETFTEPESETVEEREEGGNGDGEEPEEVAPLEERITEAQERLENVRAELVRTKQKLVDLDSDIDALSQKQKSEIDTIAKQWDGKKTELRTHLKPIKAGHKSALKELKEKRKERKKSLKTELRQLDKAVPEAEFELKVLTSRGKLQLLLADSDLIAVLKERWIAAEAAKQLDYPIFMAVSERGGKDSSGDYQPLVDGDGQLIEDDSGQPKIDQDLVNYDLRADDLTAARSIPDEQFCIAEAFVLFAQEQEFEFWRAE